MKKHNQSPQGKDRSQKFDFDQIQVHPFDFKFSQVRRHRQQYEIEEDQQKNESQPLMFYQSDPEKKRSKSTFNNRRDQSMTVAERAQAKRENMKEGIIDLKVDIDSGSDSEKDKYKNMNPIAVSGMPKPSDQKSKQWWNNCKYTEKTNLESIFRDLAQQLPKLSYENLRHILKELDQSAYDIVNLNSSVKDYVSPGNVKLVEGQRPHNLAEKLDLELLMSKIQFTDFLKVMQRESSLRDILSEHQLFYHSTKRLFFKGETRLVTKQAIEAMQANREKKVSQAKAQTQMQGNHQHSKNETKDDIIKIPTVTYSIDQMLMFEFQGTYMILVTLENKTVSVFNCTNGHFIHDFQFYNNVLTTLKHQNKQILLQMEQKEVSKSGPTSTPTAAQLNVEAQKRKQLKEQGIFDCELPKFREIIRKHPLDEQDKESKEDDEESSQSSSQTQSQPPSVQLENSSILSLKGSKYSRQVTDKTFDESQLGYRLAKEVDILERNPVLTPTDQDLAQNSQQLYKQESKNGFIKTEDLLVAKKDYQSSQNEEFWDWVMNGNDQDQSNKGRNKHNRSMAGSMQNLDVPSKFKRDNSRNQQMMRSCSQSPFQRILNRQITGEKVEMSRTNSLNSSQICGVLACRRESANKLNETNATGSTAFKPTYASTQFSKFNRMQSRQSRRHLSSSMTQNFDQLKRSKQVQIVIDEDMEYQNQPFNQLSRTMYSQSQQRLQKGPSLGQQLRRGYTGQINTTSMDSVDDPQNIVIQPSSSNRAGRNLYQRKPTKDSQKSQEKVTSQDQTEKNGRRQFDKVRSQLMSKQMEVVLGGLVGQKQEDLNKKFMDIKKEQYDDQEQKKFQRILKNQKNVAFTKDDLINKKPKVKNSDLADSGQKQRTLSEALLEEKIRKKNQNIQSTKLMNSEKNRDNLADEDDHGCHDHEQLIAPETDINLRAQTSQTAAKKQIQSQADLAKKRRMKMMEIQRLAREKIQEEQLKKMKAKKLPNGGYKILGIDPIDETDGRKLQLTRDKIQKVDEADTRAFGLQEKLFTPAHIFEQRKSDFEELMDRKSQQMTTLAKRAQNLKEVKKLEQEKELAVGDCQHSQKKSSSKSPAKKKDEPKAGDNQQMKSEQIEQYLKELQNERNVLWNKLDKSKQQHLVFEDLLENFDSSQRKMKVGSLDKEFKAFKSVAKARKAQQKSNVEQVVEYQKEREQQKEQKKQLEVSNKHHKITLREIENDKLAQEQELIDMGVIKQAESSTAAGSSLETRKNVVYNEMIKQRKRRLNQFKKEQMLVQDEKKHRRIEEKKTYPLRMAYYEPADLAIFALVTREIQIHELKQTGVVLKFTHIQSLRVEHVVECMSIAKHKVTGRLLLCMGTQSKDIEHSEIVIFELDPKDDWEVADSYKWIFQYKQITNLFYNQECGLVVTSFSGQIEIYDSINLTHHIWDIKMSNQKQLRDCGSISAIDYSEELDLIAFGGVPGIIHFIDQTTKKHLGQLNAHVSEIIMLKFYDQQHQLISVTTTGDIGLWDSQKLMKFQVLKNAPHMLQKTISSCFFYEPLGKVLMATTKVFNYELNTDSNVKIIVDQQNAIARDYLREFFKQLKDSDFISQKKEEDAKQNFLKPQRSVKFKKSGGSRGNKKDNQRLQQMQGPKIKKLSQYEYLQTAYEDNTLKDYKRKAQEYNRSVLPSVGTSLIATIFDQVHFELYTIDADLMVRVWSLDHGNAKRSYVLETRDSQIADINNGGEEDLGGNEGMNRKAQMAHADELLKFLIVCFEGGLIQINNLYTGQLIYNNYNVEPLKLENEVAQISFLTTRTRFWIAASCYDGKVAFISTPDTLQGSSYLRLQNCNCSHTRDVLALAVNNDNQLATASIDNKICFWNTFNGEESKVFKDTDVITSAKQTKIIFIKYPFSTQKDLLLVILNTGELHFLETQSERFIEFPKKGQDHCCSSQHQDSTSKLRARSSQKISKNYVMGKISSHPVLDMKEMSENNLVMISINDKGNGYITSLKYKPPMKQSSNYQVDQISQSLQINSKYKSSARSRSGNTNSKTMKSQANTNIDFHIEVRFRIEQDELERGGSFTNVTIAKDYDIFITSQVRGQVILFNINTGEQLAYLNQRYSISKMRQIQLNKENHSSQEQSRATLNTYHHNRASDILILESQPSVIDPDDMMWPSAFQKAKDINKEQYGSNQLEEQLKPKQEKKSALGDEIDLLANCKYKRKDHNELMLQRLTESKQKAESQARQNEEEQKKTEEKKHKMRKSGKKNTKTEIGRPEPDVEQVEKIDLVDNILSDDDLKFQGASQQIDVVPISQKSQQRLVSQTPGLEVESPQDSPKAKRKTKKLGKHRSFFK